MRNADPIARRLVHAYPQWFLYFTLCFVSGIACYFGLPAEPALAVCGGVLAGAVIGLILLRRSVVARFALGCLFFGLLGLTAATYRAQAVAAPKLSEPLFQVEILGRVSVVVDKSPRPKITLADVRFRNQAFVQTPRFITLTAPAEASFSAGDVVLVRADIFPPAQMTDTGAYSAARALWFEQVGATGFITDTLRHVRVGRAMGLDAPRASILSRIRQILPPDTAGIVAALVLGIDGFIAPPVYDKYRVAGIAHVLSVSGFHMALLSGLVFFLIRGLLGLMPAVALRVNTKKAAAVCALAVTGLYLALSGFQVPAVRSFFMIAVVFAGILWDRNTLSVKSLAIIAFSILIIRPELLITARFQLSFIAVLGLVSLYDALMQRGRDAAPHAAFGRKALLVCIGPLAASAIAALVTAPFVMYHFGTTATYGVLGNVCTAFLFSFLIMPLLLLAVLLMPFGWDAPAWQGAGYFLDIVSALTGRIADLPHATLHSPAFGGAVLSVIAAGIAVVCLAPGRRGLGLIPVAVGFGLIYLTPRPDVFIADRGRTIAVYESGGLRFVAHRGNTLATSMLMRRYGVEVVPLGPPRAAPDAVFVRARKVAFAPEACRNADATILFGAAGAYCPEPAFVVDGRNASPLALYLTPRPRGVWIGRIDSRRPWSK
ncbi:MAG: ComEC/Rec2 family competence protein [Alphaproteobacteria bacterium]|nr:ComEC/Rec2 family competence protein [Alphaproteobacteria bacterium]